MVPETIAPGDQLIFHTKAGCRVGGLDPAILLAALGILAGALLLVSLLLILGKSRGRAERRAWRQRLENGQGLARVPKWRSHLQTLIKDLNSWLSRYFQRGWTGAALGWWRDAGAGEGPLSFLAALLVLILLGTVFGRFFLNTALLKAFLVFTLLLGFFALIHSRARTRRRLFQDQFPAVLDRLADSLEAGFSLPQAVEFVVPNLSQPSAAELARISEQIRLGFSVDQALRELYRRRPSQDVRVLVEGLTLQRQVGGNMAGMMREMAGLVRSRVELENEVRTLTAQGRLSAAVIALLVPVSLGLLSLFPGYVDVLYKTTAGNLVLIVSGSLEALGALLVSRLVRIDI